MSDQNAGGAATKTKKNRTPLTYELLEVVYDDAGNKTGYKIVPTPPNVKKDKPRRDDFDRGVKATLETGTGLAEQYNGKQLVVAALGDLICYSAEVEEVTVRKVKVTKG